MTKSETQDTKTWVTRDSKCVSVEFNVTYELRSCIVGLVHTLDHCVTHEDLFGVVMGSEIGFGD